MKKKHSNFVDACSEYRGLLFVHIPPFQLGERRKSEKVNAHSGEKGMIWVSVIDIQQRCRCEGIKWGRDVKVLIIYANHQTNLIRW